MSVPAVPFGGIAGQIDQQRRGYHEKTHREHDTGAQYGLSILPVSAFADAGTSAAAAETTAAGTNEETTNSVVTIEIGADGLPEKQSGTGWSYDSSNNWLTITGVENAKTEYILDGDDASCNVAISTSSNEVYLLDGVVKGQLWIKNPNACVLGGSYAEAVLELSLIHI